MLSLHYCSLECAVFAMCPFWNVLFLECALLGLCPFLNVPFFECAPLWMSIIHWLDVAYYRLNLLFKKMQFLLLRNLKRVRVNFKVRVWVPEYRSTINNFSTYRFPSTSSGFWVRFQVPEYGSYTRDLFRSRFPSTGPGSRVRIQVPEYSFELFFELFCKSL